MKITKQFVKRIGKMYKQKPCDNGMKWFIENFPKGGKHEDIFQKAIDDGKIIYITWSLAYSMPKKKNVKWAIWCAEQVLPIFEAEYPNDDRPRKAIEAAKEYLKNPCDETADAAWAAAEAMYAEARVAIWVAEAARVAIWAAEATTIGADAARVMMWANDNKDLVMQILKKGFEIWRRK